MTKYTSLASDKLGEAALNLYELLKLITANPSLYRSDSTLHIALKSQGSFSAMQHRWIANDREIFSIPMSLNSLKHYCDLNIQGGFKKFDAFRKEALTALTKAKTLSNKSNKRTAKGMSLRIQELEEALDKTRKSNFIILQALSESITAINSIRSASSKKIQDKRADEHLKTLHAIVSMNFSPFDKIPNHSNITSISGRRDG